MSTHTVSTTLTFTWTNARHIASKVVADLRRLQSYYTWPSDEWLCKYHDELCELLVGGYLTSMEYGFQRDGRRVLSLLYTVRWDGTLADEHAGGVPARIDITGARWFSFVIYSDTWYRLTFADRERVKAGLPFHRVTGAGPEDGDGTWQDGRSYASGGAGIQRRVFRPRNEQP